MQKAKLSENEARVIVALKFDGDASDAAIARITNLKGPTVRAVRQRLVERKLVRYYPLVNVGCLGYAVYNLYFCSSVESLEGEEKLNRFLQSSPCVSWVSEVGGRFQYCVSILAESIESVSRFLSELSVAVGQVLLRKSIATQLSLSIFPPKYLAKSAKHGGVKAYRFGSATFKIDELDRRILSNLLQLRYDSRREFARLLKLPFSTVDDRIKRLIKSGVLVSFVYLTNPSNFGAHSFKLLVYSKGLHQRFREQLTSFCDTHPNIVVLIECIGEWDFEINVEVFDPSEVLQVSKSLTQTFPLEIASIEVLPQFKEHKTACFPFGEG